MPDKKNAGSKEVSMALTSLPGVDSKSRSSAKHKPPSPLPLFLETKPRSAFPEVKKPDAEIEKDQGGDNVDRLLARVSSVLDGGRRKRDKKMELSLQMQRARSERRRQYELSKESPPVASWVLAAEKHKGERPLKTVDDWLGYGGPKIRTSARELDKQATAESFVPRQQENHSQYDSELRANQMARNSEKLRMVEEKLAKIQGRAKVAGTLQEEKTMGLYSADEVLAKLTPADLQSVHNAFHALGGRLNLTEFVEVMLSHLPKGDWKDQSSLINNICELYSQLDVNGDGVVTWEEMFEFTIDMGRTTSKASEKLDDQILSYFPSNVVDSRGENNDGVREQFKDGEIDRMEYLAMMDKVAVIEKDSSVMKLYDAETLQLTDCLAGHRGAVLRCLHMEDTDYIVSSGADACLIFWGAYTNNQRQILPCDEVFMSLVWDPAHRFLYAGSSAGNVHQFEVPDVSAVDNRIAIRDVKQFAAHSDVVTDMLAIPDLGILVTASLDSRILVWDLAILNVRRDLNGHNRGVYSLAYIPSQRYLISAGYDHNCKVWNPMIEEPLFTMHGHTNVLAGLKVVLGSNRVITSDIDAVIKVWDIRNFMCVQTIRVEQLLPASVSGITYVGRLDRIVLSGVGHLTRRVHKMVCLDYERPAQPALADEEPLVEALYSVTNNTVTTASLKTVRVWDASTGLLWKTFAGISPASITAMCLDNRERKLIIGDEQGQIGVHNYLNGALMKRLAPHAADVCALAYCPFSRCVLSASWGGRVRVHHDNKPDKTRVLREIDGHTTDVTCMVYSPSLCLVATACTSGSVRLWDYQDVKLASSCQAHTTEVTLLLFLDEYRLVLTGDFLGNLILWTVAPWRERYKPLCRFEYIVQGQHASEGRKRDSPTCCVFHAPSHTLYVGGSAGKIVAFDTSGVLEGLLQWQGADESGKRPGGLVPPLPERQFVRNPREGRTRVPEGNVARPSLIDTIIKSSGDVSVNIADALEWGTDVMTGLKLAPRLADGAVKRRFSWRAHEDTIKTLQLIREQFHGTSPPADAAALGGTFVTEVDVEAGAEAGGGGSFEVAALLTASQDQRACLWDLDGKELGQLRQGDRDRAKNWKFPVTTEMLQGRRDAESKTLLLQVI